MNQVNLDFCLRAMGLDSLKETKERRDQIEEEKSFFDGVSFDQCLKEPYSYILTFREELQDSRYIERNHKLSLELKKDKIVAHYILIEEFKQVFPTADVEGFRREIHRSDIIAEFMPLEEDGLVVYEIGEMRQEMVEDENRGNHGFIRSIQTLMDIDLDHRNLIMEDFSTSLETNKKKKMQI